jgi:hypothetical protein
VNFGECGKSSGWHSLTSTVKSVLTVSLAKGWLRVCVDLVKGFIGVHWRGFRGDGPGWPRFDRCLTGLTRQIRSLALMTVIKNLGRHKDLHKQVLFFTYGPLSFYFFLQPSVLRSTAQIFSPSSPPYPYRSNPASLCNFTKNTPIVLRFTTIPFHL